MIKARSMEDLEPFKKVRKDGATFYNVDDDLSLLFEAKFPPKSILYARNLFADIVDCDVISTGDLGAKHLKSIWINASSINAEIIEIKNENYMLGYGPVDELYSEYKNFNDHDITCGIYYLQKDLDVDIDPDMNPRELRWNNRSETEYEAELPRPEDQYDSIEGVAFEGGNIIANEIKGAYDILAGNIHANEVDSKRITLINVTGNNVEEKDIKGHMDHYYVDDFNVYKDNLKGNIICNNLNCCDYIDALEIRANNILAGNIESYSLRKVDKCYAKNINTSKTEANFINCSGSFRSDVFAKVKFLFAKNIDVPDLTVQNCCFSETGIRSSKITEEKLWTSVRAKEKITCPVFNIVTQKTRDNVLRK